MARESAHFHMVESTAPGTREAHERLLSANMDDLGLKLAGSRLEPLVAQLYAELEGAGISLRPRVYLSDEWGCPDGIPVIGVPFYLADPALTSLQRELLDYVEADTDEEVLAYLRHESGHAFNYAYRLFDSSEWSALFGSFSTPYVDDYVPRPFSRNFVRHIPGWYAQKHPDEDFAETFAVWLTPDTDWRTEYANWGCLPKLEYVDRIVNALGRAPALVSGDYDDSHELTGPLHEHFQRFAFARREVPAHFDSDLKRLFAQHTGEADKAGAAASFILAQRRELVHNVSYWTGLGEDAVRSLVEHLAERAAQLDLHTRHSSERHTRELAVFVTTLAMNRVHRGDFVVK